jgi:phage terminase small subunit
VQQWWAQITSEYGFSPAELSLLRNAAESYQRKVEAAAAIKKHGAVFTDEKGMIRSRPEIQHERDARAAFVRTLKLLNLDRPAKPYNGPQPRALFDND